MAKTTKTYLIQLTQSDLEMLIFEAVLRALKIQNKSVADVYTAQRLLPKVNEPLEACHG